ncbi:MAG: glycosyltransferase, partial [Bacteroidota bacterium]
KGIFDYQQRKEEGLEVVQIYYSGAGARVQRRWWRIKAWRKAILALEGWRPTLLHAHVLIDGGIIASCLGFWWDVPYLISAHSSRYLEATWPKRYDIDRFLAKWSILRSSAVLPVSHALRQALVSQGFKATFRVIPNLVDDQKFLPPATERHSQQPYTLFHLSDFSQQKNLPLLLASFAQLAPYHPGVRLIIAGNGPTKNLRRWKEAHPAFSERIHILGSLRQEQVISHLQQADLFVLSSRVETQAIVVMEALLCGLPVVATRSGGPEELFANTSDGTLVGKHNPQAFSTAIAQWLTKGPEQLVTRIARAEVAHKRFSQAKNRKQLFTLYQDAVARHLANTTNT